mgnify:FL=1
MVKDRSRILLTAVYKLTAVERDGELAPSMKLSAGKATYPGQKEVYRVKRDGEYQYDVLARRGEDAEGTAKLETIFEDGRLVYDAPDLDSIRSRIRREIGRLPDSTRRVRDPTEYAVRISDGLDALAADTERELRDREL